MKITLTDKFKDLIRPKVRQEKQESIYKALYGLSEYKEPAYPKSELEYNNSDFKKNCDTLIDSLKNIMREDEAIKDQAERMESLQAVRNKIESIRGSYFRYTNDDNYIKNIKDLKKHLEYFYFNVKFIQDHSQEANVNSMIYDLEFQCLDGFVGKIIDLNNILEFDPVKTLFNVKFEYITQLVAVSLLNHEEEYFGTHIHRVYGLVEAAGHELKTYLENRNDQHIKIRPNESSNFLKTIKNCFNDGSAATAIIENYTKVLVDQLSIIEHKMENYNYHMYCGITDNIKNILSKFLININDLEDLVLRILDISPLGEEQLTINGYAEDHRAIIKCNVARYLEAQGYINGAIYENGNTIEIHTGEHYYIYDKSSKQYTNKLINIKEDIKNLIKQNDLAAFDTFMKDQEQNYKTSVLFSSSEGNYDLINLAMQTKQKKKKGSMFKKILEIASDKCLKEMFIKKHKIKNVMDCAIEMNSLNVLKTIIEQFRKKKIDISDLLLQNLNGSNDTIINSIIKTNNNKLLEHIFKTIKEESCFTELLTKKRNEINLFMLVLQDQYSDALNIILNATQVRIKDQKIVLDLSLFRDGHPSVIPFIEYIIQHNCYRGFETILNYVDYYVLGTILADVVKKVIEQNDEQATKQSDAQILKPIIEQSNEQFFNPYNIIFQNTPVLELILKAANRENFNIFSRGGVIDIIVNRKNYTVLETILDIANKNKIFKGILSFRNNCLDDHSTFIVYALRNNNYDMLKSIIRVAAKHNILIESIEHDPNSQILGLMYYLMDQSKYLELQAILDVAAENKILKEFVTTYDKKNCNIMCIAVDRAAMSHNSSVQMLRIILDTAAKNKLLKEILCMDYGLKPCVAAVKIAESHTVLRYMMHIAHQKGILQDMLFYDKANINLMNFTINNCEFMFSFIIKTLNEIRVLVDVLHNNHPDRIVINALEVGNHYAVNCILNAYKQSSGKSIKFNNKQHLVHAIEHSIEHALYKATYFSGPYGDGYSAVLDAVLSYCSDNGMLDELLNSSQKLKDFYYENKHNLSIEDDQIRKKVKTDDLEINKLEISKDQNTHENSNAKSKSDTEEMIMKYKPQKKVHYALEVMKDKEKLSNKEKYMIRKTSSQERE